jgi:hypothetical protein
MYIYFCVRIQLLEIRAMIPTQFVNANNQWIKKFQIQFTHWYLSKFYPIWGDIFRSCPAYTPIFAHKKTPLSRGFTYSAGSFILNDSMNLVV